MEPASEKWNRRKDKFSKISDGFWKLIKVQENFTKMYDRNAYNLTA